MFGYITVSKEDLSEEDLNTYKSYYCGLCRTLYTDYGNPSRFLLNNDCVFVYILDSSLNDAPENRAFEKCIAHPVKKHGEIRNGSASYAAAVNVILSYHKFRDDVADRKLIRARALGSVFKAAYEKARERYSDLDSVTASSISRLMELERSGSDNIDIVSSVTSDILGFVFKSMGGDDVVSLEELGRALGRYIYLADAWNDYQDDLKHRNYNVFIARFGKDLEEARKSAEFNIMASANQIVRSYQRIEIYKNKGILDNIIMNSIHLNAAALINKDDSKHGSV
ncbi:MAG: hypothetical protein IKR03_00145 [Clostridia bacterium]|nr:hypothetical protein [Clostridia bacterium]